MVNIKQNSPNIDFRLDNTEVAFSHLSNAEILFTYRLFKWMQYPFFHRIGLLLPSFFLNLFFIRWMIQKTIFRQFVAGETLEEASLVIRKLKDKGLHSILDYGVEYQQTKQNMDNAMQQFITSIEYKDKHAVSIQYMSIKLTALFPEHTLLSYTSKIGGNFFTFDETHQGWDIEQDWVDGVARVDVICRKASEHGVGVLIDAEESWIQGAIDVVAHRMMRLYNKEKAVVFNTFQMYRRDKLDFLYQSYDDAEKHHFFLGAKIVRGAYIEKENAYAIKNNQPSAIFPTKKEVDGSFDTGMFFCLQHGHINTMIATHNEASIIEAVRYIKKHPLAYAENLSFSQLYGMGDNISLNLINAGFCVSKYLPYGDVKSVFNYLLRRAKENSAIQGQSAREFYLLQKETQRRNLN